MILDTAPPASLLICGLGVVPREDATLETLQALESCRAVYSDLSDGPSFRWLRSHCARLLRPKTAAEVARAAKAGGLVGLAVWGHPSYASALARQVRRACRAQGVAFRTLASNSPAGAALAGAVEFLGGEEGFQSLEARALSELLEEDFRPAPGTPLVAFSQAGAAGDWRRLGRLLAPAYPPGHEARAFPSGSPRGRSVPLARLGELGRAAAVVLVPPRAAARRRARG